MLRLRISIGALLAWLFLFYNIERINEPIDIASFVYVLAPLSSAVILFAQRFFQRRRIFLLIVPMLVVFFALKVQLGYPIFNEGLPLTITEIASLLVTVLLVRQMARIVTDFEDTVSKLTFQQAGLPPRLHDSVSDEELYREVKRSRRFHHPLTLLMVVPEFATEEVELNQVLIDLQKTMAQRYMQARVAKLLSEELRDCDLIAQNSDKFAVLLPETDAEEARRVTARMMKHTADTLDVHLRIGMANFPETSLTFGGLLAAASDDLEAQNAGHRAKSRSTKSTVMADHDDDTYDETQTSNTTTT